MSKPLLSLAMMVKNEERFLEDALISAKDWVDEMVVVDTGSTDRTMEIARDLGAKVSEFPWPNSFSIARNESIKRCEGEWIAILDADERFIGDHRYRVRDLLKPSKEWPYQAFMLNIINKKLDGTTTHSFYNPRIFPNHSDIGYQGRVHNCFGSLTKGNTQDFDLVQCKGIEVVHLGYDTEVYKERNKIQRNLSLLEAAVKDEPEVARYRFYLGREYLVLKRYEDAAYYLKSVITESNIDSFLKVEAHTHYLQCLRFKKAPFEEFLTVAIQTLEEFPQDADTWYLLALSYRDQQLLDDWADALGQGLQVLTEVEQLQTSRLKSLRVNEALGLAHYYHQKLTSFDPTTQDPDRLIQQSSWINKRSQWTLYAWNESTAQDHDRNRILKLWLLCIADESNFDVLKQMIPYLLELDLEDLPFVFNQLDKFISKGNNKLLHRILRKLSSKQPSVIQMTQFQQLTKRCRTS